MTTLSMQCIYGEHGLADVADLVDELGEHRDLVRLRGDVDLAQPLQRPADGRLARRAANLQRGQDLLGGDRDPWAAALVAAGHTVLAVNPLQAAQFRRRLGVPGSKSDAGDAHVLSDMVRMHVRELRLVTGRITSRRLMLDIYAPGMSLSRRVVFGTVTSGLLGARKGEVTRTSDGCNSHRGPASSRNDSGCAAPVGG